MINDKDKNILKKLKLIKCTPEENGNFTLEFFFEPNDYFTNEVLKREFILDEDYDIKEIKSDEIQWKSDEVNPTIEIKQKKVKNKRTKQIKTVQKKEKIPSFFSSFRNFVKKEGDKKNEDKDDDEEEDEGDEMTIEDEYDQALQFKEEIIPYAIEYYLGIADDDEDDLGGEEDEEDEEEEEEEKPKPRGGKKGGYHGGRKK